MRVFTIGDLHLPFGRSKPMDIFGGWENYTQRILENWNSVVADGDCVVIPGDLCWAMSLDEALPDFEFVSRALNGKKIILKGNHDYWWCTLAKMNFFLQENGFDNIRFLHNDAVAAGKIAVCGTRGWINDDGEPQDLKVLVREAGRLEASLKAAQKTGLEPVVFIHYPPIYGEQQNDYILEVLKKYPVRSCYYGHVHGKMCFPKAFTGEREGIRYTMVSADYVKFTPVLVQE